MRVPGWWTNKYGETFPQRKERLQKRGEWSGAAGFWPTRLRLSKKLKITQTAAEQLPDMARFAPTEAEVAAYKNRAALPGMFADGSTDERHRTPDGVLMDAADWAGRSGSTRECVEWVARNIDIRDAAKLCNPPDPLAVTMWRLATLNDVSRQKFLDDWVQKLLPTGADIKREDALDLARDVAAETVNRVIGICQRVGYTVVPSGPQGPGQEPGVA